MQTLAPATPGIGDQPVRSPKPLPSFAGPQLFAPCTYCAAYGPIGAQGLASHSNKSSSKCAHVPIWLGSGCAACAGLTRSMARQLEQGICRRHSRATFAEGSMLSAHALFTANLLQGMLQEALSGDPHCGRAA